MWALLIAFSIPEIGAFIRALRICFFKSWKRPQRSHFLFIFVMESLHTIGVALLMFLVLPELDSVKAAMVTNCLCCIPGIQLLSLHKKIKDYSKNLEKNEITFASKNSSTYLHLWFLTIPGILGLLSRSSKEGRRAIKVIIDLLAISAQITGFVVWPLLENRPILWMVPVAAIMTSCAWWENYVCIHSPIGFVRAMGRAKEDLKTTRYFNCIFFSLWKILLFFCSVFVILWLQGEYPMNLFHLFGDAFGPHKIIIEEVASTLSVNLPDIIATSQVRKNSDAIQWRLK